MGSVGLLGAWVGAVVGMVVGCVGMVVAVVGWVGLLVGAVVSVPTFLRQPVKMDAAKMPESAKIANFFMVLPPFCLSSVLLCAFWRILAWQFTGGMVK